LAAEQTAGQTSFTSAGNPFGDGASTVRDRAQEVSDVMVSKTNNGEWDQTAYDPLPQEPVPTPDADLETGVTPYVPQPGNLSSDCSFEQNSDGAENNDCGTALELTQSNGCRQFCIAGSGAVSPTDWPSSSSCWSGGLNNVVFFSFVKQSAETTLVINNISCSTGDFYAAVYKKTCSSCNCGVHDNICDCFDSGSGGSAINSNYKIDCKTAAGGAGSVTLDIPDSRLAVGEEALLVVGGSSGAGCRFFVETICGRTTDDSGEREINKCEPVE
jgi:hypothetical protein